MSIPEMDSQKFSEAIDEMANELDDNFDFEEIADEFNVPIPTVISSLANELRIRHATNT